MYLETLERVLGSTDKIILDTRGRNLGPPQSIDQSRKLGD